MQIVPIEVIVRNVIAGSMAQRLGIEEGTQPSNVIYDLSYKRDDLGDPLMCESHALALKLVTKEQLEEIVKQYPTPFHLYDEKGIRARARALKAAFAWNPGFREYFAVKATPNPFILKILQEEGCGVDCSSLTELMMAEACGFSGTDIMFSSNDTPAEDFQLARKLDATINLDDLTHIDFLKKQWNTGAYCTGDQHSQ